MDTRTGNLITDEELKKFSLEEQTKFVPVNRDLSKVEQMEMQIKLYSPCGCGSGKKFKFCCKKP